MMKTDSRSEEINKMPPKCELCQTYHSQQKPCPADPAQSAPSAERVIKVTRGAASAASGPIWLKVADNKFDFSPGRFRSELKCAMPKLTSGDIEWIVGHYTSTFEAVASRLKDAELHKIAADAESECAETRAETAESALREKEFDALIPLACQMAVMAHADQLDHCGKSAVFHVFHVGFSMGTTTDMIVGLLHDSVEDANASLESIRSIFGDEVAEAVNAITHPKHEPYADYLKRVMQNPIAHRVKIVDATHNLSRTDAIQDEALRERLRKKFTNALSVLTVAAQTPPTKEK